MRLIDAFKVNETIDKFNYCLDEVMICRIKMRISAIPTVEERPHGEWKPRQMLVGVGGNGAIFMHDGYECECGRVVTQKENFCPECGASMSANDRQVTGKLNSEICPCIDCCKLDNSELCRKGCSDYQKWKGGEAE